jgi:hypothetical protein
MPLAWQMSLHLSFGETPAYLGIHSTAGPLPKEAFENSLCASHCSSLKVFPGKRMIPWRYHFRTFNSFPHLHFSRLMSTATHHYCLDSLQYYMTCSALVCLHSTFLRSLGLGCHIPSLYTELLHRRFLNSLPKAPMVPSFHEQESKWIHKSVLNIPKNLLGNEWQKIQEKN